MSTAELDRRRLQRTRRRIPCTLHLTGVAHRAMILDVSARGLFIQTAVILPEGHEVRVSVAPAGEPVMDVELRVVRRRASHRSLAAMRVPGLGLEVLRAPEAYYQLLLEWTASGAAQPANG